MDNNELVNFPVVKVIGVDEAGHQWELYIKTLRDAIRAAALVPGPEGDHTLEEIRKELILATMDVEGLQVRRKYGNKDFL